MSRITNEPRRGAIATEAVLVMIVLLMFLLLAPAIYKQWATEHLVRAEAHRATFAKTSTFLDFSLVTNFFTGGETLDAASPPDVSAGGDELTGYSDFRNTAVHGVEDATVRFSSGWQEYRGEYTIERRGAVLRPTWTWNGYPFVHTQDLIERRAIESWYNDSLGASIDDDVRDGLQLGD